MCMCMCVIMGSMPAGAALCCRCFPVIKTAAAVWLQKDANNRTGKYNIIYSYFFHLIWSFEWICSEAATIKMNVLKVCTSTKDIAFVMDFKDLELVPQRPAEFTSTCRAVLLLSPWTGLPGLRTALGRSCRRSDSNWKNWFLFSNATAASSESWLSHTRTDKQHKLLLLREDENRTGSSKPRCQTQTHNGPYYNLG